MNIGAKCEKNGYFAGSASISASPLFLNKTRTRYVRSYPFKQIKYASLSDISQFDCCLTGTFYLDASCMSHSAAQKNTTHAGRLFMITAPSGAGKSSLVKALLENDPEIELSISHTTRAPRPGEVNGREYHFISVNEFEERKARGEFLESALVHGNYYGTSRVWIEQRMAAGKDVLLEIDWQGARQVRSQFEGTVGIFILPPSIDALEARLHKRGTDSEATITRRLMGAGAEIAHAPEFEFVIINGSFDVALSQLISVVTASRLNFQNQAARHREQFISLGVPV